jgi:hypothetical protein
MATGTDLVRHEWAAGYRRLDAERETPAHYRALQAQLDAITAELRKRVGDVYDLDGLAAEYQRSDVWAQRVVAELSASDRWAPGVTVATDAAFHLFARRAQDYAP